MFLIQGEKQPNLTIAVVLERNKDETAPAAQSVPGHWYEAGVESARALPDFQEPDKG